VKTTRLEVLELAGQMIGSVRASEYGSAQENFARVAALWEAAFGWDVELHQVPLAMDLVKTARLVANPSHYDSWTDKAGYSALGAEVACGDR